MTLTLALDHPKPTKAEIYQQEGCRLVGAACEVYNERGYGMAEDIYQECLESECEFRAIPFIGKPNLACSYKERELKKSYFPDLLVFGEIVVELKAVSHLVEEHQAQLFNDLRATRQPVGYLINFGHKDSLEWKRLILSEFIPSAQMSAD